MILERWNANLAAYVKLLAEAAGGEWIEDEGAVLFLGAHPYPGTHTNGVLRVTPDGDAGALLARADAYFGPRRRSYTVWIRDEWDADLETAVRARGFSLHAPEAGMPAFVLRPPLPTATKPPPDGYVVRRITDGRDALAYLAVVGRAFGVDVPVKVLGQIFFHPRTLLDERVDAYVAYDGRGTPVAGCQTFLVDGFAGIYSAAVLPSARGLGLAQATFLAAANDAVARGADLVGGTSSDLGMTLWGGLGADVLASWRRWYGRSE